MPSDLVRAFVARRLERGAAPSLVTGALASAWATIAARNVARKVELPGSVRVVGVGSAVLGGAGKTPVAIAIARALAQEGRPVALIGHGYRARLEGDARRVSPDDDVAQVGDDALAAARALAATDTPVFVARSRAAAMELALSFGKTNLVVDGLLQASPRRLDDAVLVLDGGSPFGSGRCPPLGDLRAPVPALVAAADHVVVLGDAAAEADAPEGSIVLPSSTLGASDERGLRHGLDGLAAARVGLIVAIARPARVLDALARSRVRPEVVITLADHARFGADVLARAAALRVDAWLTTSRCATKLPPRLGGAPVLALEHQVDVCPLLPRLSSRRET